MNNVKYRAWHKTLKKMQMVVDIHLDPEFGGVSVWGKAYYDADTGEHEADKNFWQWDDIDLMQFTPLFDRLKVGIVEGDIVKVENSALGVVEYSGASFIIRMMDDKFRFPLNDIAPQYVEIVGNIYENPGLIERDEA